MRQMGGIPCFPLWCGFFECGVAGGDALFVDCANGGPIGGGHGENLVLHVWVLDFSLMRRLGGRRDFRRDACVSVSQTGKTGAVQSTNHSRYMVKALVHAS